MDRPLRGHLHTAPSARAALRLRPSSILALSTALAPNAQVVHPRLDITNRELLELPVAEVRDDVEPAEHLVVADGGRRESGAYGLSDPLVQKVPEPRGDGHDRAAACALVKTEPLLVDVGPGLPKTDLRCRLPAGVVIHTWAANPFRYG